MDSILHERFKQVIINFIIKLTLRYEIPN